MRSIELAGFGSPVSPIFNEVAFPAEFHDTRIAVAIGYVRAPSGPHDRIRRLIEIRRRRNRSLNSMRHVNPRLLAPAKGLLDSAFRIEFHNQVVARIDVPKIVLRIEADAVRNVK